MTTTMTNNQQPPRHAKPPLIKVIGWQLRRGKPPRLGAPRTTTPSFAWPIQLPPMIEASELAAWVALSRVAAGTVRRYRGEFYDGKWPIVSLMLPWQLFDTLRKRAWLAIEPPDQVGMEATVLTRTGRELLHQLEIKYRAPIPDLVP